MMKFVQFINRFSPTYNTILSTHIAQSCHVIDHCGTRSLQCCGQVVQVRQVQAPEPGSRHHLGVETDTKPRPPHSTLHVQAALTCTLKQPTTTKHDIHICPLPNMTPVYPLKTFFGVVSRLCWQGYNDNKFQAFRVHHCI